MFEQSGGAQVRHHRRDRHRDDRRDRHRRVGAAAHPSAVRETGRRPPHVRRPEHLHPAEGQPVGCDPGDLRELAALVPGAHRERPAVGRRQGVRSATTSSADARSRWFYIVAYALLILFFAYFYTAIAFNPQQQADIIRKQGGFIPGIRPGPPTERYLAKVLNRITLPGRALPHADRDRAVHRAQGLRHPALPLRRHVDPDHRGRHARDDEADRQPADDAQLRRVPVEHDRPGASRDDGGSHASCCSGSRVPARERRRIASPSTTASRTSRPATCSASRPRSAPRSGSRRSATWTTVELVPDEIVVGVVEECLAPGGPLGDGFVLDGFPRTLYQAQELDRVARRPPARRRDQHRRARRRSCSTGSPAGGCARTASACTT